MKSFNNHISLVIALLSILFSIQIFIVVDRSIKAYGENLADNYSVIVVSQKKIDVKDILSINPIIKNVQELTADNVIKRLDSGMSAKNIKLLKLTLPKFYKLNLTHFPTPLEIKKLISDLLRNKTVTKVEDFSHTHDSTYKLLLLFKSVVSVFSFVIVIVTTLLIFKELRIWQFKHTERMSIMGLFGAPVWLRSAVLFRLAIVDAIIATILSFILFSYLASHVWIIEQLDTIGIKIVIFDFVNDAPLLFGSATILSIILATLIVMGHKEEV